MAPGRTDGYGYLWVTLGFFVISLIGHWVFGWFAYLSDQAAHHQPVEVTEFLVRMSRDTLENWQSEFLQLLWQVAGLAYSLYVGSPQSKKGDERKEAKLDAILRVVDREHADEIIASLNRQYPRE